MTSTTPDAEPEPDPRTVPETRVPADGTATQCPYCGRPFPTDRLRALHVGSVHAEARSGAEREEYEAARDDEGDELFVYHLKIVGALVALYTAMVVTYMVVLGLRG